MHDAISFMVAMLSISVVATGDDSSNMAPLNVQGMCHVFELDKSAATARKQCYI